MGRKIIDTYPVVTLTIGTAGNAYTARAMTRPQAEQALAEALDSLRTAFNRDLGRQFDMEHTLVEDAACEHCNHAWTEQGSDFNGGCCSKDEANDPDRLGVLRSLANEVDGHDFYTLDEGRPSRLVINWPDALATAVLAWLDAGRPADRVPQLLPVAHRVNNEEWCTIWSGPGPSGCSLARLPDQVDPCSGPEELAEQLISLIDDMGLTPARQVAA